MKIIVTKDTVKIEEFDLVHEGEHKVNKCSFSFSAEYTKELVKKAIFTSQNSSVEVAIINNECDIPTEILRARNIVLLGVYAYKVTEDKLDLRYSPSPDAFNVNNGSYIEGASDSEEITPSQFEQYMQAMNDGLNKVEKSLTKMDEATSSANDLVNDINQKLENGDFIGPQGTQGVQGIPGTNGVDGVGITTITSGQSTVEEDKTVTPVTVQKTDGSSQIFNVEAKNGIDGQNGKDGTNGQDGLTPTIGDNGNWYLGDTDTGKPSRGEVGPSPDLSNYVKNTDYATGEKGGVVKVNSNSATVNENGYLEAQTITPEQYAAAYNSEFISKGTLENIKDDYVGSSTPVKNLNNSLRYLTPKQDAKGTDNVFDDGLKSPLYALGGDGKSEQVTTNGNQLVDWENNISKSTGISFSFIDDVLTVIGVPGAEYQSVTYDITDLIKNNPGKTINYSDVSHSVSNDSSESVAQIVVRYTDDTPIFYRVVSNYRSNQLSSYIIPEDTSNINEVNISIFTNNSSNKDVTNTVIVNKPLLYFDNNDEYEPYTGRQPSPSSDYEQPMNSIEGSLEFACRGKNLFNINDNKEKWLGGETTYTIENGKLTIKGKWYIGFLLDSLKKNTDYYVSYAAKVIKGTDARVRIYDLDKNFICTIINNTYFNSNNSTAYWILFYTGDTVEETNEIEYTDIMVKEKYPINEYEPYVEPNKVTFNLNEEKLRSVGDVKDELVVDLDTGDYYKLKNIEHLELAISNMDNTENYPGWRNVEKINEYYPNVNNIIGDIIQFKSNITINRYSIGLNTVEQSSIWLEKGKFNLTQTQWKEQYPDLVFKLDYSIPSTETIKLGTLSAEDLAKLKTFKGYNNVTVNTNLGLMNIRFTYGLDIKKYVDNKIAEISSALIEEG